MGPKKQKAASKNAFFYYMCHVKETQGKSYPGGMKEISEVAGPMWDRMDEHQRKPFVDMAKKEKNGMKYTTQGVPYDEIERIQRESVAKANLQLATIKQMLIDLGRNTGFKTAPFFFVHMNYFCQKDNGTFYPAEFALTKFSIDSGVKHTYHTMVDLGPLPQGYSLKAQQHSEDTHRIPRPPNVPNGERSVSTIMANIEKFVYEYIDPEEPMPPFFTQKGFIPSTENIMSRWGEETGRGANYFRIYSLDRLLFDMKNFGLKPEGQRIVHRNCQDDGYKFESLASNVLTVDEFCYRPNIACHFHEEADVVQHCSKSYVIRWGWMFANNLCSNMDVTMIRGQHCPMETVPEDLVVNNQAFDALSLGAWSEVGPTRSIPAQIQACGRGGLIKSNAATMAAAASTPEASKQSPYGNLSIVDHGRHNKTSQELASEHPSNCAGVGVVRSVWKIPAPPPAYEPLQIIDHGALKAQAPGMSAGNRDQFEDAPARQYSRPKHDDTKLRKPKTVSLATQLNNEAPGTSFSAQDFPSIGRGRGILPSSRPAVWMHPGEPAQHLPGSGRSPYQ